MSEVRVTVPLALIPPSTKVTLVTADADATALYNAGITYAIGDRVASGTYYVYESLQASNLAHTPGPGAVDTAWWAFAGYINEYKAFDNRNTSQTQKTSGNVFFKIAPGQVVTQIACLNITNVDEVRIQFTGVAAIGTTRDVTQSLRAGPTSPDWFHYFTDTIERVDYFFLTDVPAYDYVAIEILFRNFSIETTAVGTVIVGQSVELGGDANTGMRMGIVDYSRKETNEFGDLELVERAYSNRASVNFWVRSSRVDDILRLLARLRATPTLYEASDLYGSSRVFGFYKEAEVAVEYSDHSLITLDLEGLT